MSASIETALAVRPGAAGVVPRPPDEAARCMGLDALHLLDTPAEERFDRITGRLAELLDLPIAYVALVGGERQWLKSRVGGIPSETPRDLSFCAYTILGAEPLVVPDARLDPRFHANPMVVGEPGIRFYAGIPLRKGGHNVGTLCVADRQPRELSLEHLETLRAYSALIEAKLNAPPEVFISYSHQDEEWKDTLVNHLSVLQRQNLLNLWDDRRIGVGDQWKTDIQQAMEASNVAVLLVSASFLTSKFILEVEVPRLLARRDREGLHILPVLLKPCCWDCVEWLESMNLFPVDGQPLASRSDYERDRDLAGFTSMVLERVRGPRKLAPDGGGKRSACGSWNGEVEERGARGAAFALPAPAAGPAAALVAAARAMPEQERALATAAVAAAPAVAAPATTAPATTAPATAAPATASAATASAATTAWRIVVARRGGSEAPQCFVFGQARVVLGRAPGCDLPLPDATRVVSGRHAAITRDGGALFVTDLASKNLTYLDGEPLEPQRARPLPPGALLKIGDFELQAEVRAEVAEEQAVDVGARTLFDSTYDNPFREPARDLADLLLRIADAYRAEPSGRRDRALAEALEETLGGEPSEAARSLVARWVTAPADRRGAIPPDR